MTCKQCNEEFFSVYGNAEFCSDKCRKKFARAKNTNADIKADRGWREWTATGELLQHCPQCRAEVKTGMIIRGGYLPRLGTFGARWRGTMARCGECGKTFRL